MLVMFPELSFFLDVIPAQAGTDLPASGSLPTSHRSFCAPELQDHLAPLWVPAYAGMGVRGSASALAGTGCERRA
jgi:hypothetical protein